MKTFQVNRRCGSRMVLCVAALFIANVFIYSQAVDQADVKIKSIVISANTEKREKTATKTIFGDLKCTIVVQNEAGGYANQTQLVVVLPVDITIVSNNYVPTINRTDLANRGGWPGSMVFYLHNMHVGLEKTIEFTFTKSAYGNRISVFVYSSCPDPRPANNFQETSY